MNEKIDKQNEQFSDLPDSTKPKKWVYIVPSVIIGVITVVMLILMIIND